VQDYLSAHGWLDEADRGRFVALVGDAELDEGNVYEALIEAYKHDIRNCWWILDYNRQSLDATSADRMFERFDEIFKSCGWRVVELRWGKKLAAALEQHPAIGKWLDGLSNADLSALHYQGGAAWRARIEADLGKSASAFLKAHDDNALATLFTDLGGPCMESLVEAVDPGQREVHHVELEPEGARRCQELIAVAEHGDRDAPLAQQPCQVVGVLAVIFDDGQRGRQRTRHASIPCGMWMRTMVPWGAAGSTSMRP
jgi:hypothetical protein